MFWTGKGKLTRGSYNCLFETSSPEILTILVRTSIIWEPLQLIHIRNCNSNLRIRFGRARCALWPAVLACLYSVRASDHPLTYQGPLNGETEARHNGYVLKLPTVVAADLTFMQRRYARQPPSDVNTKASVHDSKPVVLPGSESHTKTAPAPQAPGAVSQTPSTRQTPATPSSIVTKAPEKVPLIPTPPADSKVQTTPSTSIPPTPKSQPPSGQGPSTPASASNSPSSSPPKRRSRWRRLLLTLFFLSGLSYAGGVYYSLVSDNFHDFFTEYIPYGEDAVYFFEEREFRKRFPSLTNPTRRTAPDTSNKITIPSKSGLTWKIHEDDSKATDLSTKGRHMSALDTNMRKDEVDNAQQTPSTASGTEKTKAVDKAKSDVKEVSKPSPSSEPSKAMSEPKTESPKPAPAPAPAPPAQATASAPAPTLQAGDGTPLRGPEVDEPSVLMPTAPIDPLKVPNADEPLVQDLVKILNNIIAVINADNASAKYSSSLEYAKSQLASVGRRILGLKATEQHKAREQITATQREFDKSAEELVRRLEEEMAAQELRYKQEFESERAHIAEVYSHRLQSELDRANQVTSLQHKNEILNQSIALRKSFMSDVQSLVETERSGRLAKLDSLSGSISELDDLSKKWNQVINSNLRTQRLTLAVEAVRARLASQDQPRPFINELAALKELADGDPVILAAIASIPPTAYQRGIPTTAQLIDRFRGVAREVRKASLLPTDAGIASHAASWALSKVLFKNTGATPSDTPRSSTVAEKGVPQDGSSSNAVDAEGTLGRAERMLEEGDLDGAAREVNTLEGWAGVLSGDWVAECRRVLETRQAVEVMGAETRLEGLRIE